MLTLWFEMIDDKPHLFGRYDNGRVELQAVFATVEMALRVFPKTKWS